MAWLDSNLDTLLSNYDHNIMAEEKNDYNKNLVLCQTSRTAVGFDQRTLSRGENGLTNVELLLAQFASSDGAAFNFKAPQREES